MATLFDVFKFAGVTHDDTSYRLDYLEELKVAPKDKRCHKIMLRSSKSPNRKLLIITEVSSNGQARVRSIEDNKFLTQDEAEMLRTKGSLVVSSKFIN